ncbi:MAG TPA: hypothetical protein VN825_03475 [Candidatus Acidoferrum sp.]|nr:hypothetical protein [Candidatus Acidoferrum sp.]
MKTSSPTPDAILQTAFGFWNSKVLLTAVNSISSPHSVSGGSQAQKSARNLNSILAASQIFSMRSWQ